MKLLKICSLILIGILLLNFFTVLSYAHSGRTDGDGGHYDHSTGEYHYHCGGHPAHQHPNGKCPYKNSYTSSNDSEVIQMWIFGIIVGIIIILCLVNAIIQKSYDKANALQMVEVTKKQEIIDEQQHTIETYKDLCSKSQTKVSELEKQNATWKSNADRLAEEKGKLQCEIFKLKKQAVKPENQSVSARDLNNTIYKGAKATVQSQYDIPSFFNSIERGRLANAFYSELSLQNISVSADIRSGDHYYNGVTLTTCSCQDFQERHAPCKHMLYLAYSMGVLQLNSDISRHKINSSIETLSEKSQKIKDLSKAEKKIEKNIKQKEQKLKEINQKIENTKNQNKKKA